MNHTCGLCHNGRYYYGEGEHGPCFACKEATVEVRSVLPLFYEEKRGGSLKEHLGAYGMKHDVEDFLGRYVSTEELVRAAQVTYPVFTDDADRVLGFYVKSRFPMEWIWNEVTDRPRGAKTDQWSAYQAVLAAKAERQASRAALLTEVSASASGSR